MTLSVGDIDADFKRLLTAYAVAAAQAEAALCRMQMAPIGEQVRLKDKHVAACRERDKVRRSILDRFKVTLRGADGEGIND